MRQTQKHFVQTKNRLSFYRDDFKSSSTTHEVYSKGESFDYEAVPVTATRRKDGFVVLEQAELPAGNVNAFMVVFKIS
jgi:hypothetical protein